MNAPLHFEALWPLLLDWLGERGGCRGVGWRRLIDSLMDRWIDRQMKKECEMEIEMEGKRKRERSRTAICIITHFLPTFHLNAISFPCAWCILQPMPRRLSPSRPSMHIRTRKGQRFYPNWTLGTRHRSRRARLGRSTSCPASPTQSSSSHL